METADLLQEPSTQSINENTTAVHTFSANETVTWSLNGGADASKFAINTATGALSFSSAPNYETPTDSDSGNNYIVVVRATDSAGNTSDQTVTISIAVAIGSSHFGSTRPSHRFHR